MPELPEVETISRQLKSCILGKTISDIKIIEKKQFIGESKNVLGKKITAINRFGKIISFSLGKTLYLNIHLKLTGEILFSKDSKNAVYNYDIPFTKTKKMPGKTTRIIIEFSDGSGLFFNDLRKFGWIKVSKLPEKPKGIDVLSKKFTFDCFKKIIKKTHKPIKLLLMDQEKITGIGNIYANDSLFLAGVHPLRKSNTLKAKEIFKIYKSIKKIIEQAIKNKGSSGADEAFIQIDGKKGNQQKFFLVYQKENKSCPRCQGQIKRIKQNNRSSFFCSNCQK